MGEGGSNSNFVVSETRNQTIKDHRSPSSVHDTTRSDQLTDETGSPMSPKRRTLWGTPGVRVSAGQQDIGLMQPVNTKICTIRLIFSPPVRRSRAKADQTRFCTFLQNFRPHRSPASTRVGALAETTFVVPLLHSSHVTCHSSHLHTTRRPASHRAP